MKRPSPLLLAFLVAVGCGPSFQRVYEGDVKFEHCYANDENAQATNEEKRACWQEWRTSYTYGQSRDRVDYAISRSAALSQDAKTIVDGERVASAAQARTVAAPVPTSAFAPPPNMLPHPDAKADTPAPKAPRAACSDACLSTWQGCRESCKDKACDVCDRKYGQCVPACFHEEPKRVGR